MDKNQAIAVLNQNQEPLRSLGILHAAVFGSSARGDAGPDSDIDVLIELAPGARTVFDLVGIEQAVVAMISPRAHVAIADQLKPALRDSILGDATFAF